MQILREEILLPKIADKVIVIDVLVAQRRRSSVCCAMYTTLLEGPLTMTDVVVDFLSAYIVSMRCLLSLGFLCVDMSRCEMIDDVSLFDALMIEMMMGSGPRPFVYFV